MRLVRALDAILTIIAFRRKQLCDLVDAACRATTIDPGRVEHALADLELMIAQVILRRQNYDIQTAAETGTRSAAILASCLNSITEIDRKGIVFTRSETAVGRLCCKSTKLPGDKILAIRRTNRRPPIYAASVTLPSSPARSSSGNEVPSHLYTKVASTARRIFGHQCKKTFATISARSGHTKTHIILSAFGVKRTSAA